MTEKLIRLPELMAITSMKKSTIYDMQRAQKFPQSLRLSRRCVAWKSTDVQNWISSREQKANS